MDELELLGRQLYPDLDPATESALRASILRFGVLVAVSVDQDGEIIDGHHRSRLAGELGVKYETRVHQIDDEQEALDLARTLNEDRRMLTKEQRLPAVFALRQEGHTQIAIARALGVSQQLVAKDLGEEFTTRSKLPETVVGVDGKTYPATKKPNGKRGHRAAHKKDTPFEVKHQRGEWVAKGHASRLTDGLSEISGICRGLRDLDMGIAAAGFEEAELQTWIKKAGELSAALSDIKRRLKEATHGIA